MIFVTAYDEYAVRAFDACALDYLLKPTSPQRLARALARARDHIAAHVRQPAAEATESKRFVVRGNGRVSFVAPEEIDWVEAAGNYVILHVGPNNHMLRDTMAHLEGSLDPEVFVRANRSTILNLRRVAKLHTPPDGKTVAVLVDDQRIRVTKPIREMMESLASITPDLPENEGKPRAPGGI